MHPRKASLPDPTNPSLRRWVIDLTPEKMHREVCARLRGRPDLEREAFAAWTLAGFPGWPEHQSETPSVLRFRLAERLTISSPLVRLEHSLIPLLPFRAAVDPGPPHPAPGIPTPGQLAGQQIIAHLQRALTDRWWIPIERGASLLAEYEAIHKWICGFRPADRRLWRFLERRAGRSRLVRIGRVAYPLPSRESCGRDPKPEPARATETLLAGRHHTHASAVHASLIRARAERRIEGAWEAYAGWLGQHPGGWAELDQVLPQMTREITGPARDLSSPSDGQTLAPPSS